MAATRSSPTPPAGVGSVEPVRDRLRRDLTAAIKARDRAAVSALRKAISAIENNEVPDVVDLAGPPAQSRHFAGSRVGLGAAEVDRRTLTAADVRDVVEALMDEMQQATGAYARLGHHDLSGALRAEIVVLRDYLG